MSDAIRELIERLGSEGILAIPRPGYEDQAMDEHLDWQYRYVTAGFIGNDQDAILVREYVQVVRSWYAFVKETSAARESGNGNSRMVVDLIGPAQNALFNALDELMKIATIRMIALDIEPPKHPATIAVEDAKEKEQTRPRGHGFVPPMGHAS